jgi:multiple sugar transport system ATP-binding protein
MTTQTVAPENATSVAKALSLRKLVKVYRARRRSEDFMAVRGIDLEIPAGELIALLGPSGCGKTTTLRMIAGLETVTDGEIYIGDRVVNDLPPAKREIGMGFESYALYPPLNVRENLSYGIKARKEPDADERVNAIAKSLEMEDMLDLRPGSLSSGQKQRVALARALIRNPPVLLLDEPLSHLDAAQRERVRRELKILQRRFGYTTIVVTHDQIEALSLADRLAVMDAGIIRQFGTPDEIYNDPADDFVADFVGEPKINMFEAVVRKVSGKTVVEVGDSMLETAAQTVPEGTKVKVGLRPQDTQEVRTSVAAAGQFGLKSKVRVFEYFHESGLLNLDVAGLEEVFVIETAVDELYDTGDELLVSADPARVYLFDLESGLRLR